MELFKCNCLTRLPRAWIGPSRNVSKYYTTISFHIIRNLIELGSGETRLQCIAWEMFAELKKKKTNLIFDMCEIWRLFVWFSTRKTLRE